MTFFSFILNAQNKSEKTIFDFDQVLLVYNGSDPLLRYQVEGKIANKAAEFGLKCIPSVNLIPEGTDYTKVNVDSFKQVLVNKNINAAVTIEVAADNFKYKKKKNKGKANKAQSPNTNGDFQFATYALNANRGQSLYTKKTKAIYVKVVFRSIQHILLEEIVEIKKPKSNEDAINKLSKWVEEQLKNVEK